MADLNEFTFKTTKSPDAPWLLLGALTGDRDMIYVYVHDETETIVGVSAGSRSEANAKLEADSYNVIEEGSGPIE